VPQRAKITLPDDMPLMVLAYWLDAVGSCGTLEKGDPFPPAPRLSGLFLRQTCASHTTLCQTWDHLTEPWDSPLTIPNGILAGMWELRVGARIR
jgi:hypothetical protein